jgi:nicotinamidase-related amidase
VVALSASVLATPLVAMPTATAQDLPRIPDPAPVTLDPRTTAFLVLDLVPPNCSPRPACVASLGPVARFLAIARAAGVFVVHSSTAAAGMNFMPEVVPLADEPVVITVADKFYDTNLDALLRARGIETVIIVGTSSIGAVLYTSFGANARGYTVVVAEDGISGSNDFQYFLARYQVLNQPGFANPDNELLRPRAATLSRTDLIDFQPALMR